jgi:hypothetical protein
METAMVVRQQQQLNPTIWQTITAVAPVMKDSRLFGVATEAQAAAIMAKGFELGLTLTASFEFIQVIQNKPTLTPRGALALVQQSGQLEGMKIEDLKNGKGDPDFCRVWMKRRGGFEYTAEFSMADATRAGLVKKDGPWETYPSNMLRWRAVGFCIDVVFPDVIGGMKRADEFEANLDASGNVVDGTWTTQQTVTTQQAQPSPMQPPTLQELVAQFGPEAVMEANDGKIPSTEDELWKVGALLA